MLSYSRDRAFALLAISSDAIELGIIPNYSKPPKQLFVDASISFFQLRKDLGALNSACITDNLSVSENVSWAIHPSRRAESRPVEIQSELFRPHPYRDAPISPRFYAHGGNHILVLRCRVVDHILVVNPPLYKPIWMMLGIDNIQSLNYMVQLVESIMGVLLEVGITLENIAPLARALIINPNWKPAHGLGSTTQQTTYHFWCYYLRRLSILKSLAGCLAVEVPKASDFENFISSRSIGFAD
jgi:hypothetical protein